MKRPICYECKVEANHVYIGGLTSDWIWVCPKCKKEIDEYGYMVRTNYKKPDTELEGETNTTNGFGEIFDEEEII